MENHLRVLGRSVCEKNCSGNRVEDLVVQEAAKPCVILDRGGGLCQRLVGEPAEVLVYCSYFLRKMGGKLLWTGCV